MVGDDDDHTVHVQRHPRKGNWWMCRRVFVYGEKASGIGWWYWWPWRWRRWKGEMVVGGGGDDDEVQVTWTGIHCSEKCV